MACRKNRHTVGSNGCSQSTHAELGRLQVRFHEPVDVGFVYVRIGQMAAESHGFRDLLADFLCKLCSPVQQE